MVLDGDIKDSEGVDEALQQIEVIYTADALNTIRISDNDQEYWEQMGGEAPDWSTVAAFAKQADVREALDFDPENIEKHECARCGDVVTIEEDAAECPKCGLSFDVTVSEGAEICVEGASEDTCNSCLEEHPEVKDSAITRLADYEFTCYYCNGDFITPQAPVAPPPQASGCWGRTRPR
jgi:Zn finger protein HypA/HybF involved in hydrogenase expression